MFQRSWVRTAATYTGWTFFTILCCKNCNVCMKRRSKLKRGRGYLILRSSCLGIAHKIESLRLETFVAKKTFLWTQNFLKLFLSYFFRNNPFHIFVQKLSGRLPRQYFWRHELAEQMVSSTNIHRFRSPHQRYIMWMMESASYPFGFDRWGREGFCQTVVYSGTVN